MTQGLGALRILVVDDNEQMRTIIGTVLGALIFGVIISGFTFLKLDAYYQEMVKGVIIVAAVVLDQWRQKGRARG